MPVYECEKTNTTNYIYIIYKPNLTYGITIPILFSYSKLLYKFWIYILRW